MDFANNQLPTVQSDNEIEQQGKSLIWKIKVL